MLSAVLLAAIVAALVYRHTRPITFMNDTCQFLRAARKIREERRFPGILEYNLMDAIEGVEWDYPPLLILIYSLFPSEVLERRLRLFSLLSDLPCMVAVGSMVWLLDSRPEAALLAMALYCYTPSVIGQTFMLTARFLSITLFTVSIGLMLHFLSGGESWAAVLAALTGALLLLSNALAIQAWLLVLGALALFSPHRWVWIAYGAAAIALCYLLAGRIAWRVHRGLFVKLWVLKKYRMDDLRIGQFHLLQKIRGQAPKEGGGLRRDLRIFMRSVLLLDYPYLWVLALPALWGRALPPADRDLWVWLGVCLLCHLAIDTLPGLRFIGPAYRYLSYAFLPVSLLVCRVALDPRYVLPAAILLGVTLAGAMALTIRRLQIARRSQHLDTDELRAVGRRLRELPVERILVMPMPLSDALGYFSGKSFLHGWASRAWSVGPRYGIYPVLERPLDEIARTFRLDCLVIKKDYVRLEELKVSHAHMLEEIGSYEVYRIGGEA